MGTAGNHGQAGNHRSLASKGITWLVALYQRVSGTVPRRDSGDENPRGPVERDVAVIIAKRAIRLNNRNAKQAAKYERKHTILAAGRQ